MSEHPVDALKEAGFPMLPEAEAEMRAICDEPVLVMSRADAEAIAEMASVCFSEGLGPDCSDLLHRIRGLYPDIAKKYSWLPEFAEARMIKVVLTDGISTKDGCA